VASAQSAITAGLLALFSASSGAGLVGFTQSGEGTASRSLEEKLREVGGVSLTDFLGADPTGVGDSTAAWNAANAHAAQAIYVPDGVFVIGEGTLTNKRAYGPGVLKWKGGAVLPMLTLVGGAKLVDLEIDGNAAAQAADVTMIVTDNARRGRLKDCYIHSVRGKAFQTDVALSRYFKVEGCDFEDCGEITACDAVGIRSPYCRVTGCSFVNVGDGHCVRVGLFNEDDTSVPVRGTIIEGNHYDVSEHVAVTLELYAQYTVINGNVINGTESAIKAEAAGGTVFGIAAVGNAIMDTAITTSMNMVVPKVAFLGNLLANVPGPVDLGSDSAALGNVLDTVGDATRASINQQSTSSGLAALGNVVLNAPFRGVVGINNLAALGNIIRNTVEAAIRHAGNGSAVLGNIADTAASGVTMPAASSNFAVAYNVAKTVASPVSYVNNAASATARVSNNVNSNGTTLLYTLASDAFAVSHAGDNARVDTEGAAAADDLVNITGGYIGQPLTVRSTSAARVITARDGTGNLRLAGDFVFTSTNHRLVLEWDGATWAELSRAANG
jgi:hypothetical protein